MDVDTFTVPLTQDTALICDYESKRTRFGRTESDIKSLFNLLHIDFRWPWRIGKNVTHRPGSCCCRWQVTLHSSRCEMHRVLANPMSYAALILIALRSSSYTVGERKGHTLLFVINHSVDNMRALIEWRDEPTDVGGSVSSIQTSNEDTRAKNLRETRSLMVQRLTRRRVVLRVEFKCLCTCNKRLSRAIRIRDFFFNYTACHGQKAGGEQQGFHRRGCAHTTTPSTGGP